MPYISTHLERVMTNEMSQHESHLANHIDRPTALPAALTGGNARLDGGSPYTRGSLFITDGAVEVPYGERDIVIMWPCYMHAVIPPVGHAPQEKHVSGGAVPRRMSYLHYNTHGGAVTLLRVQGCG